MFDAHIDVAVELTKSAVFASTSAVEGTPAGILTAFA